MLRNLARIAAVAAVAISLSDTAKAAFIGFASNPTTNSIDWTNSVTGLGGVINTNVNFNSHPLGGLNPNFYLGSDGVTLTAVGDSNTVTFGAGPGQSNTGSPPLSPGEGPHAPSNYLFDNGSASSLTISFANPVLGAGLFVIDYFNPGTTWNNLLTIEAFSGANGTGTLLGTVNSVAFNFQPNRMYFMGVVDTAGGIGSIRFNDINSSSGDTTGIDDIRFATAGTSAVPEPTSLALFGIGSLGVLFVRRRRQALVAAN